MIDAKQLARELAAKLGRYPWFSTVGADGLRLVVFVHRTPTGPEREQVPLTFGGLPVNIRYARQAATTEAAT